MVSPLTMKIALLCYYGGSPVEIAEQWGSAPGIEARRWLYEQGVIDRDGYITDKGRAWIERALSTPMPRQAWVFDPAPEGAGRETGEGAGDGLDRR